MMTCYQKNLDKMNLTILKKIINIDQNELYERSKNK
jgi:hypothetical protein